MKKLTHLFISSFLILSLNACQSLPVSTFSPEYEITQHVLIDKIWSVSAQKFISNKDLNRQLVKSKIVLLGETHDNARHHQLQAQVITELANNHSPVVAFEMLNQNRQDTIDKFQSQYYSPSSNSTQLTSSKKVELFSQQINWEKSGWPKWDYYRPVFYSSIDKELPIIAANLNIKTIRNVIKQGSKILEPHYQDLLNKYQYEPSVKEELKKEILSAHCDMLPEKMLSPMLLGQQVRDIAMAQIIIYSITDQSTKEKSQLVLIAGSGHTRTDYGIPYYLSREIPRAETTSLAFIEVEADEFNPESYVKGWSDTAEKLPFDYVWFTKKAAREDQCEKMKAHMKKKSKPQSETN